MSRADDIIHRFGLSPLSVEGGYFIETHRSSEAVPSHALPRRGGDGFYSQDPVEMLQLHPNGSHSIVIIGNDLAAGHVPQVIAPAGTWQGCRLVPGGEYALMGTTVAPGFDHLGYEHGDRDALTSQHPDCADMIHRLTLKGEQT